MENASKALIIAGGVLIALMIIGLIVVMYNNVKTVNNGDTESTRSQQITEFNQQYTTYDRNNVRGSDLYSLLNKVIDYNRRESSAGTRGQSDSAGWADNGQDINYSPMTITFTFKKNGTGGSIRNQLSVDTNRLFNKDSYTVSGNKNSETDFINIKKKIDVLENGDTATHKVGYGQDVLTNLTTGMSKIFLTGNPTDDKKQEAVNQYNRLVHQNQKVSNWDELQTKKEDVYTYYEYIQFKRARFDCTHTEYDTKTGRITELDFTANGKFN